MQAKRSTAQSQRVGEIPLNGKGMLRYADEEIV